MESYDAIHLFLDRDKWGSLRTKQALDWSPKYKDQSKSFAKFKDLNECLVSTMKTRLEQLRRRGRHL